MKKFLSVLLALLILATFVCGCKSKNNESQQSTGQETEYVDEGENVGGAAEVSSGSQASSVEAVVKPSSQSASSDNSSGNAASYEPTGSSACKHYNHTRTVKQKLGCETDEIAVCVCNDCYYTWETTRAAKGHTEVVDPGKPATYSKDGVSPSSYCADCGKVLSPQRKIPKLNKYDTPEIPA